MTRGRTLLIALGVLALAIIVGLILGNVGLGIVLGLVVGLILFMSFESRRGRNQGVNDEDHGIEL
ncbi:MULTISPECIES: hypothetical protein [Microbacterium]|uniref:Uncharacterized protein n=1 Tax=Microbacterium barkeri TaxID=33917 RepID=A0A9W6H5Y5_9MICO|nr:MULTISPECIES: hypothetical protein [Microbacterium]MDI6944657.1 hypothetical protein [Microbacterium barkeri]MDR6877166.1 hypothetical protein [Microbacterium barkeri]WRH16496.1 hypothetical protein GC092_02515 [Microbacterium sp. JZ37]GLJ62675.1 hypothetical protein GCM10017576_28060 [Microbacterium barkeri]